MKIKLLNKREELYSRKVMKELASNDESEQECGAFTAAAAHFDKYLAVSAAVAQENKIISL